MGKLTLRFNDSEAILTASGDLVISAADTFKEKLIEAFDNADLITLRLQKIKAVDLAIAQVLCAAQRAAISRRKNLVVDAGQGALGDFIVSAGLASCEDGGCGCSQACWFEERSSKQ